MLPGTLKYLRRKMCSCFTYSSYDCSARRLRESSRISVWNSRLSSVVAAPVGARAHGEHPARLAHLVVHLAQCGRHLVAQRPGDDHQIGLARTGTKHLGPETPDVVARRGGVHHLDRATGQAEGHRPERTGLSPVDHRVVARGHEAFFHYAFNHRVSSLCGAFIPNPARPFSIRRQSPLPEWREIRTRRQSPSCRPPGATPPTGRGRRFQGRKE